jgi:hypothetical protein
MQTFKQPQKIFIDRGVLSPAAPLECRQIKLGWMQEGTSRIFGMCSRYLKVVIPCSWDEMWFEMWRCGWCFICKINKNWGRWRHDRLDARRSGSRALHVRRTAFDNVDTPASFFRGSIKDDAVWNWGRGWLKKVDLDKDPAATVKSAPS